MNPWQMGAFAANAGFRAVQTYQAQVTQSRIARAQAVGDRIRAEALLADLPFAELQQQMALGQVRMASTAFQGELAMTESSQARIELETAMAELEAEQQTRRRMEAAQLATDRDVATASALGVDPSTSGTFAVLQAENQRIAAEDVAAIRTSAAARRAGLTAEGARVLGDRAAIVMGEGANQGQAVQLSRTAVGLMNAQREGTYARDVARFSERVARRGERTAWVAAVGSLMGSGANFQRAR